MLLAIPCMPLITDWVWMYPSPAATSMPVTSTGFAYLIICFFWYAGMVYLLVYKRNKPFLATWNGALPVTDGYSDHNSGAYTAPTGAAIIVANPTSDEGMNTSLMISGHGSVSGAAPSSESLAALYGPNTNNSNTAVEHDSSDAL
jgi:hypothetical protein